MLKVPPLAGQIDARCYFRCISFMCFHLQSIVTLIRLFNMHNIHIFMYKYQPDRRVVVYFCIIYIYRPDRRVVYFWMYFFYVFPLRVNTSIYFFCHFDMMFQSKYSLCLYHAGFGNKCFGIKCIW